MKERWRRIPRTCGKFFASDLGQVMSRGGVILRNFPTPHGYTTNNVVLQGKRRSAFTHELVRAAFRGWPPVTLDVDHKDRNKSNNALSNLRLATRGQNNINTFKPKVKRAGAVVGVTPWRGKWRASITYNYKSIHLGVFLDHAKACSVRATAEKKYFGQFAPTRPGVEYLKKLPTTRLRRKPRFTGVRRIKDRWQAFHSGSTFWKHIGTYSTERRAAQARVAFLRKRRR